MLLPERFNHCIWCGSPFLIVGFQKRDGEVVRSLEHIIPANLFGHLKTLDVCVDCNSTFGSRVDFKLLNDLNVFKAALAAEFKPEEILPDFLVTGSTPDGHRFTYRVKDGRWQLAPSFHASGFKIGLVNGASSSTDLNNAKQKMLKVVKSNRHLGISESDAVKFVESLFSEFLEKQALVAVYNDRIKQGLRAQPIPNRGEIRITTHPWETQWAVAKIAYEAGRMLIPELLQRKIATALQQLRSFAANRKFGVGIFHHRTMRRPAGRLHRLGVVIDGSALTFAVRFFDREEWKVSFRVQHRGKPASLKPFELVVLNHCSSTGEQVEMLENGSRIELT